jgi:murein DD-endopeptidase MepM/ murein hydrolase activator NlpD
MIYPCKFTVPHTGLKWLQWSPTNNAWHCGQDLNWGVGSADLGNPIVTPMKSYVEYVSGGPAHWNSYNHGYGLFVVLRHPEVGLWSRYAHLKMVEPIPGEVGLLAEGVKFAEVGKSGTQSPHLHWEMWNEKMNEIQKNYTRPYGYWPAGRSQVWIKQYYINPLEFMEQHIPSDWSKEQWNWGLKNGLLTDSSLPRNQITKEEFITILKRYHDKFNK